MDREIAGVLEQRCRGSPNCGESERNQTCWISADETNETWQLVFLALSRLSLFLTTAEWHLERRRSCALVLSQNSTEIEFVGLGEWRLLETVGVPEKVFRFGLHSLVVLTRTC